MLKEYGKELIVDLSDCNTECFTREKLTELFVGLAKVTDMELALEPFFWDEHNFEGDDFGENHLCGTSAFHFIRTSNITVHTLNKLGAVFVNLFTCKDFDESDALKYLTNFFSTDDYTYCVVYRHFNEAKKETVA